MADNTLYYGDNLDVLRQSAVEEKPENAKEKQK